jgi:hypothetical protein
MRHLRVSRIWANRYLYALALKEKPLWFLTGDLVPTEQRKQLQMISKRSGSLTDMLPGLDASVEKLLAHGLSRSKTRPPLSMTVVSHAIEELRYASWIALEMIEREVSKGQPAEREMTTLIVELCRVYESASGEAMIASREYYAYEMNIVNSRKVFGLRPPTKDGAARRFVEIVLREVLNMEPNREALNDDLLVAKNVLHPKSASPK